MGYMKLSLWLSLLITMMMMTFNTASRHGEKIHFQDSAELGEFDIDERPGNGHGPRNHRGRGRGHYKHVHMPRFEQGIPGVYPMTGPPQAPLVLPSHPGRGNGLQTSNFQSIQDKEPQLNNNLPLQLPAVQTPNYLPIATETVQPQIFNQPAVSQTPNNPYADNPFLANVQRANVVETANVIPTNKSNPPISQGVTNQLPTSDKPPTTVNPRRFDLFYGSNLLEEKETERKGKSDDQTEISFDGRGIFDTAPHCRAGQILVNNRCRTEV